VSLSELRDEERDDLVGLPAIAEEIGMNPSSVRKWVLTGRLPARKDGRKWLVSRAHVLELARSDEWQRPSAARERLLATAGETGRARPAAVQGRAPSAEVRITAESAQEEMHAAGLAWSSAMRTMWSYPERLRLLAAAAEQQHRALMHASVVDLPWRPREGARHLRAPFELAKENRPPAPPALWERFDHTLGRLGRLLEGQSSLAVANGFAELSLVLQDLVTALEATEPSRRRRVKRSGS
jgi:hypothetical protein